jgi:outer membrane protein assembly factor BamB
MPLPPAHQQNAPMPAQRHAGECAELQGRLVTGRCRRVARLNLGAILLAFDLFALAPASAPAQNGGILTLPDMPFVIPTPPDFVFTSPPPTGDVLTQRNDNLRTGTYSWRGLNQNTVREFRKMAEWNVDGAVLAQPLFANSATINNITQPAVFIATSKNRIYAFAPNERAPDRPLWTTSLGAPFNGGCNGDGEKNIGVEATPVIDLTNKQLLVSYRSQAGEQRVAALSLADGRLLKDNTGRMHDVPVPGTNADWHILHRSRASLLLSDGVLYVAFGGMCEGPGETRPLHGSIVAFDAITLQVVGTYHVTEGDMDGGGIWQGATGPAADGHGNVYFATGNRRLNIQELARDPDAESLTNSVIQLRAEKVPRPQSPGQDVRNYGIKFEVSNSFTPYRKAWHDYNDMDIASTGVLLIPGTRFLAAAGKEGIIYLLNGMQFGGFQRVANWDFLNMLTKLPKKQAEEPDDPALDYMHQKFQAGINTYQNDPDPQIRDANTVRLSDWPNWPHIHGTPVFARFGRNNEFLFVWPEKDKIKRFRWLGERFDVDALQGGAPAAPPSFRTANGMIMGGMPGGMLSATVDPSGDGLGVVFASVPDCADGSPPCLQQAFGILRAFDPMTMNEVWNNGTQPGRHRDDYYFSKFVPPTIANGNVYLPTASGKVIVYGR